MKSRKIQIVFVAVLFLIIYAFISNSLSLKKSVDINEDYLSNHATIENVEKILHVEKFTENESVVVGLAEDTEGFLHAFIMWDGHSRYAYVHSDKIYKFKLTDNNQYFYSEDTKFGEVYYCLYVNPTDDKIILDGKEHNVYRFKHKVEGTTYELGFYCGLNEK